MWWTYAYSHIYTHKYVYIHIHTTSMFFFLLGGGTLEAYGSSWARNWIQAAAATNITAATTLDPYPMHYSRNSSALQLLIWDIDESIGQRASKEKWKNNPKLITNALFYDEGTCFGIIFERRILNLGVSFSFEVIFSLIGLFFSHQKS